MKYKQFFLDEKIKNVCLFCGKRARSTLVRYDSFLVTCSECNCEGYKARLAALASLEKTEALANARRAYLEALVEEKKVKKGLEAATMQVEKTKKEFKKQQRISLSEKKNEK
jgi:hypothetical protein